jgi:hypothetical protein
MCKPFSKGTLEESVTATLRKSCCRKPSEYIQLKVMGKWMGHSILNKMDQMDQRTDVSMQFLLANSDWRTVVFAGAWRMPTSSRQHYRNYEGGIKDFDPARNKHIWSSTLCSGAFLHNVGLAWLGFPCTVWIINSWSMIIQWSFFIDWNWPDGFRV